MTEPARGMLALFFAKDLVRLSVQTAPIFRTMAPFSSVPFFDAVDL